MFSHCLHPSAQAIPSSTSSSQLRLGVTGHDRVTVDAQNDVDVALKNLVGDGAVNAVQRWADHGKLLEKFAIVRDYLDKEEHAVVDKLLGTNRSTRPVSGRPLPDPPERPFGDKGKGKETSTARYYVRESEEDTDFGDNDDERGRTAHKLFASLAGIDEEDKENMWWFSPPSSQVAEQDADISQELSKPGSQGRGEAVGNGAWRLNCPTPAVSSPIRASTNRSGLKSCDVTTPRQSQLSASVCKKVAAKSPATSTPNSRLITQSTGATVGSLAFPTCLLSSSPEVPAKGRRRTPERIKPSAGPSHVRRTVLPKPHALNSTTKGSKSIPATSSMNNLLIRETENCDHQGENIVPSSLPPTYVFDTSPHVSAKRKHITDERPSLAPDGSKKRRHLASTIDPQPEVTLHPINNVVVCRVAVDSNLETQIPSKENLISTEREKLALKRMDIAQQLANAYPHLVAPSYEQKRANQLAKLMKKEQGRASATKQSLVQSQTIFSFETVDDDDGGMDWNRSKQLADDLRDAVANGRRPVLPSLKCAQSPSPSPERCR